MAGKRNSRSAASLLAQAAHYVDPVTGAVAPPIHPSSTFARGADHQLIGEFEYSRSGSPTCDQVEEVLAELEGADGALLFASGLAAFAAFFETVDAGSHVVVPSVMYHGGWSMLLRLKRKRGLELSVFDAAESGSLAEAVVAGKTAVIWVETLLNPTWDVVDIAEAAKIAHDAGAVLVVDSTVSPAVTTRPLELGADIVFHSATKYLNGHSDLTGGVLASAKADERWSEIASVRTLTGATMGAFEAWLLLRGMRTLSVRYEKASENALRVARHFEGHANVSAVLYAGLESHPGHAIARRQMTGGFGGMLSLMINGSAAEAVKVVTALELVIPATSLGGVETLIEHRATVEGPDSNVAENLLRLSVGIESADEIIDDLEQALSQL